MDQDTNDRTWMQRAIELAALGEGLVEPNPMVGCVLVKEGQIVGEGWHKEFGGPHAEINAIQAAGEQSAGATAYVTLEPCSHHGKTGPCSHALIAAKVDRVVIAHPDPNPQVAGQGIEALQQAGVAVEIGLLQNQAAQGLAPYLKKISTGLPWIIGKWAMSLDGKIATSTGSSQWISNESSRAVAHQLRGRVDAIMVGVGTAMTDDPMLNARPSTVRSQLRVVLDSTGRLDAGSQLCQTADQYPTLIAVGPQIEPVRIDQLQATGCDVWLGKQEDSNERLKSLLTELAQRGVTNLLVEGGGSVLGSFNDLELIDEIHVFLAAKLVGGANALGPLGGSGIDLVSSARQMEFDAIRFLDDNLYLTARKMS